MKNQHPDKSTSQARRQPSIGGSQTSNTSKTKSSPIKIEEEKGEINKAEDQKLISW